MHGHRAYRVVQLGTDHQVIHHQHHQPPDAADDHGLGGGNGVTVRGDRHQAREHAVQGHQQRVDAQGGTQHAGDVGDEAAGHGGEDGVGDDARHLLVEGQGAAAVEPDPADHEEQQAEQRQGRVAAGDLLRLTVAKATLARADHEQGGQADPAPHAVDHRGAGEIDEPAFREPARVAGECAAPGPVSRDRVDDRGHQYAQGEVAVEAHTLGDDPGDDGHRGGAEHRLEQEETRQPGGVVPDRCHELVAAHQSLEAVTEHQGEARQPEQEHRDHEVGGVLHRHIDGVLAARHPGFHAEEAGLHEQHEGEAEGQPEDVEDFYAHGACLSD